MQIDEIQIIPVRPNNGLVGFVSFVVNGDLYVGNVAIYTKLSGGYRLVWPTRKVGDRDISIVYPISKEAGAAIEAAVTEKYNDLMGGEIL